MKYTVVTTIERHPDWEIEAVLEDERGQKVRIWTEGHSELALALRAAYNADSWITIGPFVEATK